MLNYNKKINDRFVLNIYNDIVDIVNKDDNMRNEVNGDILRIVIFVEDKDSKFTSFSLETGDL